MCQLFWPAIDVLGDLRMYELFDPLAGYIPDDSNRTPTKVWLKDFLELVFFYTLFF